MSSKRVWAVKGRYVGQNWSAGSFSVEHDSVDSALEDVEYLWDAGFGSSMRSYVVPV